MSAADILFAPLQPWRSDVDAIIRFYHSKRKYHPVSGFMVPDRPAAALDLMELCRLFHEDRHRQFYVAIYQPDNARKPHLAAFVFDGKIMFETDPLKYSYLKVYPPRSLLDLNLYPNRYNGTFVFSEYELADAYTKDVLDDLVP